MHATFLRRGASSRVACATAGAGPRLLASGICVVLLAVASGSASAQAPPSQTIELEQAVVLAKENGLAKAAGADVAISQGERRTAETIRFNPVLSLAAGPRFGDARSTDLEASLSQTFELGGKRRKRAAMARARLRSQEARRRRTQQEIAWEVRRTFARAGLAKLRVLAAREAEEVAKSLLELTGERLAAGKGTQLEVNQASAEVARSRAAVLGAEQTYDESCYALSSAVGVDGDTKLEPAGKFERPPAALVSENAIRRTVQENRPEYVEYTAEREAVEAERKLEDSLRIPDVAIGATFAREEGGVDIVTVGLSFELPLWNRNQGSRDAARAAVVRTRELTRYASSEIEREASVAYLRYKRARESVEAFDSGARGNLRANLDLTRDSFEAGKISIIEFSVLRASFVGVELAYLDAVDAELAALFDLRLALGADPVSQ